ncbi:MAG: type II toxin-antitoxin system VapC family toxin [Desulfobacteraceae bacterium]|nr:type II toxin-antitoxin system VapC family toxin [Desulfobacteraceae bacterium]
MKQYDEIKLYLDTSIPSAFYDTSKPVRQLVTQKWFEYKARAYTLYTSATTVDEIEELDNTEKRQNIMDIIFDYHVNILELSEEAVILAEEYMNRGAVPKSEQEDAYHIAIASVNRLDCLASWNFLIPTDFVDIYNRLILLNISILVITI